MSGGITWLASYPKSGNTWLRVFLANVLNEGTGPVDINRLSIPNFGDRQWWDDALGWNTSDFTEDAVFKTRLDVQNAIGRSGQPIFKTHDAFSRPKAKTPLFSTTAARSAIYIVRNPLDVALSYANHMNKDVDTAIAKMNNIEAMMADNSTGTRLQVSQYMGDWSWHVCSWVDAIGLKVHVMKYEDMLDAPQATFARACEFMGMTPTAGKIAAALEHSKIEALQEQERRVGFREKPRKCGQFFNEGRAGRWRDVLKKSQVKAITRVHGPTMNRFGYDTTVAR